MPNTSTLVLIKPDALKLSLTGYLLSSLSKLHTGLRISGAKVVHVSRLLAEEHYDEHREKPFFENLIDYLMGRLHYPDTIEKRRVIALVYSGEDAIQQVRAIAGPTNPHKAREEQPATLRALGTVINHPETAFIDRIDNLVHTSADADDAEREIKLWFRPHDIMPGMHLYPTEVCEEHYYYKDGELDKVHHVGDTCLLAPGDLAWASDMEALRCHLAGRQSCQSLSSVAAKYLINAHLEAE